MQEPPPRARWLWMVPSALSALRLCLAAAFPLTGPRWWPALVIAAGASDLADGFLARRYGLASWIGGLIDAVADKAFVLTVLVTLVARGWLDAWEVTLLLSRDVVVGALAGNAVLRREWGAFRRMPSRPLGKLTTAAVFALLLALVLFPRAVPLRSVCFLAATGLSVAAAVDYFRRFLRASRPEKGTG